MTDYSGLIARVRSPYALTERDAQEIADALEAQAKEIADSKEWAAKVEDANDWLIERNRTLDARIAELEAALKDLREAAYDVDEMDMLFSQRNEWGCCLARADKALKGAKE